MYIVFGLAMAIAMAHAPARSSGEAPPQFIGWIFAGMGCAFFVLMIVVAATRFVAGRCINRRKSRTYCMVIAGLGLLEFPLGTILGIATFIVLSRKSVAKMFAVQPAG
jgi:hypothetical protein